MQRIVFWLNAVLTIPFGIATLIAPGFVFGQFGIVIDGAASGVARGYGATALALGLAYALLGNIAVRDVVLPLLIASVVFNGLELVVQLPLALGGQVASSIWVTIIGHAVALVLTVLGLQQAAARPA